MRLPGARRLVRSLLIATVTGILLGAAVGATNGAEAQARPAVAVPMPHLGDRGAYTLSLDSSYEDGPTGGQGPFPFLAFQWTAGAPARAADGLVHDTDRVQTSGWEYEGWAVALKHLRDNSQYAQYYAGIPDYPVWVRHNESVLFERGGSLLLGTEADVHEVAYKNATVPNLGTGGGIGPINRNANLYQQVRVTNGTARTFQSGTAADCLFVNALQNRTLAVGDEVSLGDGCSLHGVLVLMGATLRAAAMETVQGIPAMRLDTTTRSGPMDGDTGYHFGGGRVTFWVASGIPYPVRIAWGPSAGHGTSVMELAGYQPGTDPRLPAGAPGGPAPAIALATPKPWGLDETGIHHPFPMSEAFTGARDDSRFTTLRDFLKAHPDAYVASALYDVGATSDTGTQRTWKFTVTDGDSWMDVTAQRTDKPRGPLGLPIPVDLPGGAAANTSYGGGVVGHGSQYYFGLYPTPPEAPDLLPTVASLMARWEAYASPDYAARGPDSWGFTVNCFRIMEKACRSVWVTSWAGHADATAGPNQLDQSATPPTLRATGDGHESQLLLVNNQTVSLVESSQLASDRTGIAPAPPLGQGSVGPASEARPPVALASWVPSPGQAAGVGAAAFAVGLLYYLWPLAKGGLGLFSRLKQPEVLAHPARQQLLQLIEAQPGIHFKEMARRTGLPNGSLVHHLETLRRSGQVVARPAGGYTLYFLGAHVPAGSAESASALKADGARKILDAVRQQPGLSSADVAARCGLQPSTVTYHVQRLQAAGLLQGLRDGRSVRLHPMESGAAA